MKKIITKKQAALKKNRKIQLKRKFEMETFQLKLIELESSLSSFKERTDVKLENLCNRMDSLESFNRENRGEFTEMEITTISVDENMITQQQKVKN